MSDCYFPLYVKDHEAATAHLTLVEDGAYSRLLRLCWRQADFGIPDDPDWIMRHMRVGPSEFRSVVVPILLEFFRHDGGRWRSPDLREWRDRYRRSQPRPAIPTDVQQAVRERDGEACVYCGSASGPFHLDHVLPWSLGGSHTAENLVVACAACNWSKGGKTLAEWMGAE